MFVKGQLGIQSMTRFQYLSKSGCYKVDDVDDSKEFNDVLKAMKVINISQKDQEQIFNIIAGLLHLGNVNFIENGNYAQLQNDSCK